MHSNILIIGLGPYCFFTHVSILHELEIQPKIVVELESRRTQTRIMLDAIGYNSTELITLPDSERDLKEMNIVSRGVLEDAVRKYGITHAIISTEPKAHFAYLKFCISMELDTLCEKPITAVVNATVDITAAQQIGSEYEELISMLAKKTCRIFVNVKRRSHPGYLLLQSLIRETSARFGIPVTSLEISASDGMWNFPNEFTDRENHPYKYGYGKLFHSGYHFVDLLSMLILPSFAEIGSPKIEVKSQAFARRPSDALGVLNEKFYNQFFGSRADFKNAFKHPSQFDDYGELDLFSNFDFRSDDRGLTLASVNLLNTSFSRRSWVDLPFDTYRSNGRVRHERVNVHVGPLLNLQFLEFGVLKMPGDEVISEYPVSEILIFRNSALTGGKSYEKIQMSELMGQSNVNEEKDLLRKFLSGERSQSELQQHGSSIQLLQLLAETLSSDQSRAATPIGTRLHY